MAALKVDLAVIPDARHAQAGSQKAVQNAGLPAGLRPPGMTK
jgi:hypothetical protein